MNRYILRDRTPIPCDDLLAWGAWIECADRRVALTKIGRTEVSTVFLGLDHNFSFEPESPPLLFETMVFEPRGDYPLWRFATWEEAEAGHQAMVQLVKLDRERRHRKAFNQLVSRLY